MFCSLFFRKLRNDVFCIAGFCIVTCHFYFIIGTNVGIKKIIKNIVSIISLLGDMAISFAVKGVRDLSGEGDLLMALRKADLFSADFGQLAFNVGPW